MTRIASLMAAMATLLVVLWQPVTAQAAAKTVVWAPALDDDGEYKFGETDGRLKADGSYITLNYQGTKLVTRTPDDPYYLGWALNPTKMYWIAATIPSGDSVTLSHYCLSWLNAWGIETGENYLTAGHVQECSYGVAALVWYTGTDAGQKGIDPTVEALAAIHESYKSLIPGKEVILPVPPALFKKIHAQIGTGQVEAKPVTKATVVASLPDKLKEVLADHDARITANATAIAGLQEVTDKLITDFKALPVGGTVDLSVVNDRLDAIEAHLKKLSPEGIQAQFGLGKRERNEIRRRIDALEAGEKAHEERHDEVTAQLTWMSCLIMTPEVERVAKCPEPKK